MIETAGVITANLGTMVAGVIFILSRINKVDERNGIRVSAVHKRLDDLMKSVMPREDVMTHIERLDRQVEKAINGRQGAQR